MNHGTTANPWSMDSRPWGGVAAPGLRRSSWFSPMMSALGGEATEMATQRRSIEAVGGAMMGRWFRARGGEIRAGVDAIDNGGALVTPF
jgi:hypothetical protein